MGLFGDVSKRVRVEKELHEFFAKYTNINLHKVSGWQLAKVTDRYLEQIKQYEAPNDVEELVIYLMLLHDAGLFDRLNNEMLLGVLIRLYKNDEERSADDGSQSVFRGDIREKLEAFVRSRVLM